MDLSKLPRLSKTETPAPTPDAPAAEAEAAAPAPVRRGAFCDRCGAALRPGARFCDGCGTPVAARGSTAVDYGSAREPGDGIAMDVWFSLILGLVFLLLGRGL